MKLDVGCGPECLPGFVGVDRFPLPGVQVVADLDRPLPFASNSIELVHASHSLEHVSDLMFTMRELYRVCKHKAQICIVVPYYEQNLNLSNPYHHQVFNEHTPRFWTNFSWAPIDQKEYYHPHAVPWGLSQSDHSDPGLDIRLLRMEFFYFPRFNHFEPSCQRELRQHLTDVCHQVVYHLVVWKSDDDDDYMKLASDLYGYPFLDTPSLQKSRADANAYQAEDSLILARVENSFSEKLKAQHEHIVVCERQLLRNQKLIALLLGEPDLPEVDLKRLNDYLEANYRFRKPRELRLGKEVPKDGYIEYRLTGNGAYTSISLCVYLSADTEFAQLGVEVIDKNNQIVWCSTEGLSGVNTVGVVHFLLGKSLLQEDVGFVRVFGRKLDVSVQMVECSVAPRLPFRSSRIIPYACLTNDE